MKTLWGGRFRGSADPAFQSFNASFPFDRRLLAEELAASRAYGAGLHRAGILSSDEWGVLQKGLATLAAKVKEAGSGLVATEDAVDSCEDVHAYVESKLADLCGPAALKLHTGRSRNEQTAVNLRLYVKSQAAAVVAGLDALCAALLGHAKAHADLILPGYTHLQRAQPLLWAHYLTSYATMLTRDRTRFQQVILAADACPLGSGAIAGNAFGLDRAFVAAELGFSRVTENSLDATSDRDFISDFLHAAALAMVHLSRMSEDLIIFSTEEFGFLKLGDAVTTGSSLMPQKKNPDALELIRGKTGRVVGHLTALLCTLKGLPSGYNKDLQEDKEALFDAADTLAAALAVMATVIETMTPVPEAMLHAASTGYLNATELAEYLVRKGMPFRTAHETVGKIVRHAEDSGKLLADLSLPALREHSPLFDADVHKVLTPAAAVAAKAVPGGTAPAAVAQTIAALKA